MLLFIVAIKTNTICNRWTENDELIATQWECSWNNVYLVRQSDDPILVKLAFISIGSDFHLMSKRTIVFSHVHQTKHSTFLLFFSHSKFVFACHRSTTLSVNIASVARTTASTSTAPVVAPRKKVRTTSHCKHAVSSSPHLWTVLNRLPVSTYGWCNANPGSYILVLVFCKYNKNSIYNVWIFLPWTLKPLLNRLVLVSVKQSFTRLQPHLVSGEKQTIVKYKIFILCCLYIFFLLLYN